MLKKSKNITSILILGLFAFACTEYGTQIDIGQPFGLAVGERVRVGTDLEVTFEKVLGDSRCPSDVTCIQQGEATVLVGVVKKDKAIGNFELTALDQNTATAKFEGYTLHLKELMPWPVSTKHIAPEEYIAIFKIEITAKN